MAYNHLNTPTKCDIKLCQMCHFIKLNWFIKTRWWRCRGFSVITINYSKSSEHRIHTGSSGWHNSSFLTTHKQTPGTTTCGVVHSAGNLGCNNSFIHQYNVDVQGVDIPAIHNKNQFVFHTFQNHIQFNLLEEYIVYALDTQRYAYYIFKKVLNQSVSLTCISARPLNMLKWNAKKNFVWNYGK